MEQIIVTSSNEMDEERHQRAIAEKVLRGYCQHIPCEAVDYILSILRTYGLFPALEAAAALVTLDEIHKRYG